MQDLHSIPGTGPALFFPGVIVGGNDVPTTPNSSSSSFTDRLLRLQPPHQDLRCPRCDSPNTKFCYYNNYNLSQPRHFCKSCRRYWTKGGVLRNVPVGGGCRKPKRSSSTSTVSSKPSKSSKRVVTTPASHSSSDNSVSDPGPPAFHRPAKSVTGLRIFPDADLVENSATGFSYNFADFSTSFHILPAHQLEQHHQMKVEDALAVVEEVKLSPSEEISSVGFADHMDPLDLPPLLDQRIGIADELTGIDWHGCLDSTLELVGPTTIAGDQNLFWDSFSYIL